MWLSTLQYAWSIFFYFGVTLAFITAIGACKKLSQDKGKTYAHLSAAVAANAPQWRAALADTTPQQQPATIEEDDGSDRRRRGYDSSSYETEDELEEDRRERARGRERELERERLRIEREKEKERGREEKEREKRRREEESDEADPSAGLHSRRRRRPHSAGGGGEEVEDDQQLVFLKGSSGSSDEQLLDDGYSSSPESPTSPTSPFPYLTYSASTSSHLQPPLGSRSSHHSSSASRVSALGPLILPSVDVLAYRELVRVVHSAWREGLLRSQRTLIGTLIEREKERGRLTDIAALVLSRVITMYETRRRKAADNKEGEQGEMDEADVEADVYSLLQAGERKDADNPTDTSAIVSSIKAAATLASTSGEQDEEGLQAEMEPPVDAQSATGALNLRLQHLLSLPMPAPATFQLEQPVDLSQLSSSASVASPSAPLPPLPASPAFDPVLLANRYLSDSHTARSTIAQQLCTDKPDLPLQSHSSPSDATSSLTSSTSHLANSSSFPSSNGASVLRPVYAVASLQTRYLNVELLSEMELVMFAVQQRMEQLVADKLTEWMRRDDPSSHTSRDAGDQTARASGAAHSAAFSSPQAHHPTPASTSSSPSFSPGAPQPFTTPAPLSSLPPPPSADIKRSASSDSAPLPAAAQPSTSHHIHHSSAASPSPPSIAASTVPRGRALSFVDKHVAYVASSSPLQTKQLRKHSAASATATRTPTPATPHSLTHAASSSVATYYHTSPPFTPNHTTPTVTATAASLTRPPSQNHSPFHSATSPSAVTYVPLLPPRPPSSGGSPRMARTRVAAAGASNRKGATENGGMAGVSYVVMDGAVNGNGSGKVGSGGAGGGRSRDEKPVVKHLRSKSLIGFDPSPYVRETI